MYRVIFTQRALKDWKNRVSDHRVIIVVLQIFVYSERAL